MHDAGVRERIRRMMASGDLPRHAANRIAAGYGDGTSCGICGETMKRSDVTYQLRFGSTHESARSIVMHFQCYVLWEKERDGEPERDGEGESDPE